MANIADWPTWAIVTAAVLAVSIATPAIGWANRRYLAWTIRRTQRQILRTQRQILRDRGPEAQPVDDALDRKRHP